jgi:type III restriction enzyme
MADAITNPILNPPFGSPSRHYEMGPHGRTDVIRQGRRPSESFVPIAAARRGRQGADGAMQDILDFDVTGQRRERNTFVNDLRREVERWRHRDYERVTPTSRTLSPAVEIPAWTPIRSPMRICCGR